MSEEAGSFRERWPALLGLFVLLPAVVADVVVFSLATRGRHAWVEAVRLSSSGVFFLTAVLGSFALAHVFLATRAALRAPSGDAGPFGNAGNRTLQWMTGAMVAVFLGVQVFRHSPVAAAFSGSSTIAVYERMRSELSRIPWLVLYVVGFTATALHVFQGLSAAVERFGRSASAPLRRVFTFAAFASSVVLLALAFYGLAHFATGRTVLPAAPTPAAPVSPSPA